MLTTDGNNFSARSAKLSGANFAFADVAIIVTKTKPIKALVIVGN
jgi:hypothetical protein